MQMWYRDVDLFTSLKFKNPKINQSVHDKTIEFIITTSILVRKKAM